MKNSVGIGLAGLGTVGAGVYSNLQKNGALLRERSGADLRVVRAAVKDITKPRALDLPEGFLTSHWMDLVLDPEVQIIVELMGGIDEPLQLFREAIPAGKTIVTGNKALLAEHGPEIFQLAREYGVRVFYEAAVAGGIPIIKVVRESFVGNRIENMQGILNGTSNYILTRMQDTGMEFAPALQEAQELGYAEADPTLDVNGWDAAHKAIILASLAYGKWISPQDIFVEGIECITSDDIRFARELGYRIKLLASISADTAGRVAVRVCPTLIPQAHVLASVSGVFNAIWVRGDVVGESLFYGRGAGQDPTSSSVLADLSEAALSISRPGGCAGFSAHDHYGTCLPVRDSVSQFYLRLRVEDRPGVLASVAGVLGTHGIGISSVIQPEATVVGPLPLVLMIHDAPFGKVSDACAEIASLSCVKEEPRLLHAEHLKRGAEA